MKIVLENSDCEIWHKEQVVSNLISAIHTNEHILVHLNFEGPCAASLGLYELLNFICDQFNADKNRFLIETCNQIEHNSTYKISYQVPLKGVSQLQQQLRMHPTGHKVITDNIKHFGNFVGHGNRIRLAIASHLYHKHKNKSLQSYHTDIKNPYFDQFIGLEDLMFNDYSMEQIDMAFAFLKITPLKLDDIRSYPILHEDKVYDILDYYPQFFVDIINQTYFSGKTFYLDDKFWRSVITKTPFIAQGPQHFYQNLKMLGFKTFDQWWDEGYSEDPPDHQVNLILEVIDRLATKSIQDLAIMHEEMKPILDHNYNVFMSLDHHSFEVFR